MRHLHKYHLVRQLQTELQVSRIEGAASLSEVQGIYAIFPCEVCSRELEIGVIKHIECLCPKLKAHSLRKVEIFKNRHVRSPECRPYKGVAPQIAQAAQARRCKEVFWQVEATSPLIMRGIHIAGRGIWPVIPYAVKIVITTRVQAVRRIGYKASCVCRTSTRNQFGESPGTRAAIKWRPMGAALE